MAGFGMQIFESICDLVILIISMLYQVVGALCSDPDDDLSNLPESARHTSHPHELQHKTLEMDYTCDGCKMLGRGPRYSCKQCNFHLHEVCMVSRPNSPATCHEFIPNATFKFLYRRPGSCKNAKCKDCYRRCEACAKPTEGYVFYEDGIDNWKGIIFHPCCFKLPKELFAGVTEYELREIANLSSKCCLCKKKQLQGSVTGNTGWRYVSKSCSIHVFCAMKRRWRKRIQSNLLKSIASGQEPYEHSSM